MTARGYMIGPNGAVNLQSLLASCTLTCLRVACAITLPPKQISPSLRPLLTATR
jgi:hypothetical protein